MELPTDNTTVSISRLDNEDGGEYIIKSKRQY